MRPVCDYLQGRDTFYCLSVYPVQVFTLSESWQESAMQEAYRDFGNWVSDDKLPIVYHESYNIKFFGVEKLHPFDSTKFQKVKHGLEREGLIRPDQVYISYWSHSHFNTFCWQSQSMSRFCKSRQYNQTCNLRPAQIPSWTVWNSSGYTQEILRMKFSFCLKCGSEALGTLYQRKNCTCHTSDPKLMIVEAVTTACLWSACVKVNLYLYFKIWTTI